MPTWPRNRCAVCSSSRDQRREACLSMPTSRTRNVPPSGISSKLRHLRNVDFPQPDGPIREISSPRSTMREIPLSTALAPKLLARPRASRTISCVSDSVQHPMVIIDQQCHLMECALEGLAGRDNGYYRDIAERRTGPFTAMPEGFVIEREHVRVGWRHYAASRR